MTRFKVLSAGLIAAAMLTTPVIAREYRHVAKGADVSAQRGALDGRDCVRAPDPEGPRRSRSRTRHNSGNPHCYPDLMRETNRHVIARRRYKSKGPSDDRFDDR
jgi:hypothetical protein